MKILINLIFALLCFSSVSTAQEMKISGTVYDTTGTKPLLNAVAMAVRVKDSTLLGFTRTNASGFFDLKGIERDTFALTISHPQFDDRTFFIFGNDDNDTINIPSVKMASKSQLIDEVVIYAYKDPIYYKGDTLVYVADSFKVNENAVVEDLLKKLPGIEVDKDGKIKSQGQDISQVLVDGDEFFGSDPTIATKNLGAKGIATVEVYEKENEGGTFGDDEKIKVLDLKLKDDAKKGYFGRVSGASDFGLTQGSPFYEGELLLNRFNGSQKISVFALGTNTPRSSFGWGDANKFGLENEETGGSRWDNGNTTNTSGIPKTLKAGVYYSDKFGAKKNGKITMNYSFYNNELESNSASRSQYFLADSSYFTDDSTNNYSTSQSHRFNVKFRTNIDSLTSIGIEPSLRYDIQDDNITDINQFLSSTGTKTVSTNINNQSSSAGTQLDSEFWLERKFMKKKRELRLEYGLYNTQNKTEANLLSQTLSFTNPLANDTIDQSRQNINGELSHRGYAEYTEPLGKKFKLITGYQYTTEKNDQDKKTYGYQNGGYTDFRQELSNVFENKRNEHRGGTKLVFETRKYTVGLRGDVRNVSIENNNIITGNVINQNITNFLPAFDFMFKPSMSKRVSVRYNTSSQQPSITDLQPVQNNANPNRIQIGNPDLKPNYVHTVNINFNRWEAMTGRYIWSGFNGSIINNAFSTNTKYNNFGGTESQTINVDGNINSSVYAGAGFPFFKRKFIVQPNASGSFFRYSSLINDEKNTTDNLALNGGLELRFEFDSLEFSIGNNYNYTSPKSSLNAGSNTPYSFQSYNARFMWRLPKGFKVETDIQYNINSQRADGYNLAYMLWNAEISKSFLKTQNLVLSIIGKDMLNQNINAQRQVNGNIITDNRTTIISRYFLMKLTLRFNNNKTKEEDFNGWH